MKNEIFNIHGWEKKYFENNKILIRQIISDTLLATIDYDRYYADQTLYIAIEYENITIPLEYCLALLNSKILFSNTSLLYKPVINRDK